MAISKPAQAAVLEFNTKRGFAASLLGKQDGDVVSEDLFLQALTIEVRRTERSGRPFVLVLITSSAFTGESGSRFVHDLAATIQASIRETDWMGWYEQHKTLGIIMTEVCGADEPKLAFLTNKIKQAIQEGVSPQEFETISMIVRLFPQHPGHDKPDRWDDDIYHRLVRKHGPASVGIILKRAIDIAGSLSAMLLFLPIFVIIAIVVKLTSPGPVFFCQKRVGQHGKLFDFYKFRSMYLNNDQELHREYITHLIEGSKHAQRSNGMYKLESDPRVTRVGRFLRKSSLDELPQFFNVLRGDMSLVGPRPPLPYEVERYRLWHRRRVLDIKPGLTGLWQVVGRSRTTFDEMVRMDLHYARTRSLWMDIKLILRTPAAMFTGNGAS
jgi:lipopolysaccharide/colanic/teichoic acid biosynthesis glycosyltransferase